MNKYFGKPCENCEKLGFDHCQCKQVRPNFDPSFTIECAAGTLRAYRVSGDESEIWLDDEKINTHYGNQFAVINTMREWREYYRKAAEDERVFVSGTDWSKFETPQEYYGLEARG